nr:MAG TPA: YfiB membrane protein [Caudoviricetes sp.]
MRNRANSWPRRWRHEIKPWLALALCGLLLSACATQQTPEPRAICKQPAIPETVLKSDLPDAKAYSAKAQSWLEKVRAYLSE